MPAPVRRCSGCCRHTGLHWAGGLCPSLVFPGSHLRPLSPETPATFHLDARGQPADLGPAQSVSAPKSPLQPPPPRLCELGSPPGSSPVIRARPLAAGEGGAGPVRRNPVPAGLAASTRGHSPTTLLRSAPTWIGKLLRPSDVTLPASSHWSQTVNACAPAPDLGDVPFPQQTISTTSASSLGSLRLRAAPPLGVATTPSSQAPPSESRLHAHVPQSSVGIY